MTGTRVVRGIRMACAAAIVSVALAAPASAQALGFTQRQIDAPRPGGEMGSRVDPRTDGEHIAWVPFPGPSVRAWDRASGASRTVGGIHNYSYELAAEVYAGRFFWDSGSLSCWNSRTQSETVIGPTPTAGLSADAGHAVWDAVDASAVRDREIFVWNALTQRTTQLTRNTYKDSRPVVCGNRVAWQTYDGRDTGIMLHDLARGTTRRIGFGRSGGFGPAINERFVAWHDEQGAVWAWDSRTGESHRMVVGAVHAAPLDRPVVSLDGDVIVWDDELGRIRTAHAAYLPWHPGEARVPEWNMTPFAVGTLPRVSEGLVAYTPAGAGGTSAIVLWDLSAEHPYAQRASRLSTVPVDPTGRSGKDVALSQDLLAYGSSERTGIWAVDIDRARRVSGTDRYGAAVAAAQRAFPEWSGVADVVVASGDDRAASDALCAASLTSAYDAPLLLVSGRGAPAATRIALKEIVAVNSAVTLHVVGGGSSVPTSVIATLAGDSPGRVSSERIAAHDRYALAAEIARRVALRNGGSVPVGLVANGSDPMKRFDAAALSAVSAAQGFPVLLVTNSSVPSHTADALADIGAGRVVVGGGAASVSDAVVAQLSAERWWGPDRFATASVIASNSVHPANGWLSPKFVGIGAALPDALTGGAMMGRLGGPLLLSRTGYSVPGATLDWLDSRATGIEDVFVIGGWQSIPNPALSRVSEVAYD
jgi:putative cell wall-binding protein